ncbi:dihydroorotate oxidase [Candidatus Woesearchaeota archaeon]|nr:dihydroorotate oxidase [Candidatus Woesearchaeota archaeon]
MASIATEICGISMETCVFNAAGPADVTLEELEVIGKSKSSAITMKSCTLEAREGNPEPRYRDLAFGSINSMGLPNLGYRKYIEFVAALKKFGKPIIPSISGLTRQDNEIIFEAFNDSEADFIEFNPGSPNTIGKPTAGYDMQYVDELLTAALGISNKPVGIKLPPYFDFVHFEQAWKVLKKHDIKFISTINSVGNALVIDPEKEQTVIKPKGGFGGLGGQYIKPTALANVRKFYELSEGKTPIIGVGGVFTGVDAFEYILAGATAVQVGTAFLQHGPGVFERIQKELREYMDKKGYETLEDFRGKLKVIE